MSKKANFPLKSKKNIDTLFSGLSMDIKQTKAVFKTLSTQEKNLYSENVPSKKILSLKHNPRPLSVSIEDAFFGDSGKGAVIAKLNRIYSKKHKLFSLRYNGGGNAGHEAQIDGKMVVTHSLPMGVIQEGATAIMGRGMLIHPDDILIELAYIKKQFGGLPGELLIDQYAILSLDTHRGYETVLNAHTMGGRGSTGRGIATGYASFYERIALTVKDLMDRRWKETFSEHYRLYEKFVRGFGKEYELKNVSVTTLLPEKKRTVGSEKEFLERLEEARRKLKPFASDSIFTLLSDTWKDAKIAVTLEGAQGAALDPFHGVYPDVTASRCMSRYINDSTYNIILPEEISYRLAVMKTTYMSSVGIRKLPTALDSSRVTWIQQAFDERGRSTGRLRDIYEVSLPIGSFIQRAAGYDGIAATHLDASQKNAKIPVVIGYKDKDGKETPYLPFQSALDNLNPVTVTFKGWDGNAIKNAKKPSDLPEEAQRYLSFLSQTIAPVMMGTYGPELTDYISWSTDF